MRLFIKYHRDYMRDIQLLSERAAREFITFHSPAEIAGGDVQRWLDCAPSGSYVQVDGYHVGVLDQSLDNELPILDPKMREYARAKR